jgi:heat shock protein HtpX
MVQAMSYAAVFLLIANFVSLIIDGEPKISWIAIIILYLAPLLSSLMQLGLSRTREYDADLDAAQLTGNPAWLQSALLQLERHTGDVWEDLMMPVPGRRVPQPSLLRTHPTTEERIKRLSELAPTAEQPPLIIREEPFVSMIGMGAIALRPRHRFPGIWF